MQNIVAFDAEECSDFLFNRMVDEYIHLNLNVDFTITKKIIQMSLPPIGSHLVSRRCGGLYTHHGVYVGNGNVVHYEGFAGGVNIHDVIPIDQFARSSIRCVSLEVFCGGNEFFIQKHNCPKFSQQEIVERAMSKIGESEYNLIWNNCEHFANWCIEGEKKSEQVRGVALDLISPVFSKLPIPKTPFSFQLFVCTYLTKFPFDIGKKELEYIRDNRRRMEELCAELIPAMQETRRRFEQYSKNFLEKTRCEIEKALDRLEKANIDDRGDDFDVGLKQIANAWGVKI